MSNDDLMNLAAVQNAELAESLPPRFEDLATELRFKVYSNLSFLRCIQFSGRSNSNLRTQMLRHCYEIAHTISDEDGRYEICDAINDQLKPEFIPFVRNIELSDCRWWESFIDTDGDPAVFTNRVATMMELLTTKGCNSINSATFSLAFFHFEDHWFTTFSDLTSSSLSNLTIKTNFMTYYSFIMIHHILIRFRNLTCLSLEPYSDENIVKLMQRRSMTYFIKTAQDILLNRIQDEFPPRAPTLQHGYNAALTDLSILFDSFSIDHHEPSTGDMFRAMPNLTRLTVNAELVFDSDTIINAGRAMRLLFLGVNEHCPRLESFQIRVFPSKQEFMNGFYGPPLKHTFIQEHFRGAIAKKISIVSVDSTNAVRYIHEILHFFRESLNIVRIESRDLRKVQNFDIDFQLPKVRFVSIAFNGTQSIQMETHRDSIAMSHIDEFLERFPNLRELELEGIGMNNSVLRRLLRFTRLDSLVLTKFSGRVISDFRNFRAMFPGSVTVNGRLI